MRRGSLVCGGIASGRGGGRRLVGTGISGVNEGAHAIIDPGDAALQVAFPGCFELGHALGGNGGQEGQIVVEGVEAGLAGEDEDGADADSTAGADGDGGVVSEVRRAHDAAEIGCAAIGIELDGDAAAREDAVAWVGVKAEGAAGQRQPDLLVGVTGLQPSQRRIVPTVSVCLSPGPGQHALGAAVGQAREGGEDSCSGGQAGAKVCGAETAYQGAQRQAR